MRDEEIVELFFRRDERAIDETSRKYGNYCYTIASNILGNSQDVDECLDDTYMKVWRSIPPTRPRIFKTFLAKITRNLAFNMFEMHRTQKRGGGVIVEVLDELYECIPDNSNVEQRALESELVSIIRDFVRNLPEREADIFTCRYFYTESIEEIAKKLGLKKNNVSVILNRLRDKLADRLKKEEYLVS